MIICGKILKQNLANLQFLKDREIAEQGRGLWPLLGGKSVNFVVKTTKFTLLKDFQTCDIGLATRHERWVPKIKTVG